MRSGVHVSVWVQLTDTRRPPPCRYTGMAASPASGTGSAPRTPTRLNPQQTGFTQIGSRPGTTNESTGSAMSVLLSWHEKVVDVAGLGCVTRVMSDWRRA